MIGKTSNQNQQNLFGPLLKDFIDMGHELILLSNKIDWKYFENDFSQYCSYTGQPAMPIRSMVGSLLLKRIYNLSDERLVEAWAMSPYMQYFCGMAHFCHQFPCGPSDFVHFRKRIGENGAEKIFAYSVNLFGSAAKERSTLSDTTVAENNTTFPTDSKSAKKIMDKCNDIARKENITQRQTYVRTSKQLLRDTHDRKHPKRYKKAKKADAKLKTIAGRLLRELERELPKQVLETYENQFDLYYRVLHQKRTDKSKIYSIHKPFTACIAKGKAHKQYEFGTKTGLITTSKALTITAIKSFKGNPHDGKTIAPLLEQMQSNMNHTPKEIVYGRGGKGIEQMGNTKISTPDYRPLKRDTDYQKRSKRKKFGRRAAIEPVIGHLKTDYRLNQNYLWGENPPQINAFLAATGWNLKKMMKQLKEAIKNLLSNIFNLIFSLNYLPQK